MNQALVRNELRFTALVTLIVGRLAGDEQIMSREVAAITTLPLTNTNGIDSPGRKG